MLLLLLAACTGADPDTGDTDTGDTDTGDTDTGPDLLDCDTGGECCHAELPWLYMCFEDLHDDEAYVGTFNRWGTGRITFETTAGDVIPVWVVGDAEAFTATPDLAAAGEVTVTQQGGCDGKGGIYAAVHLAGASGDTLFLSGSTAVTDLGGWTVEADYDVTSCGAQAGDTCREFVHERPITVTRGAATDVYWQGDDRAFGEAYTVRVNRSSTGSGELLCDDANMQATNYWIVGPG